MKVIFVCSANVCRSPFLAALLTVAQPEIVVASAGIRPVAVDVPDALRAQYIDMALPLPTVTGHGLEEVGADDADLLLAADREVLREMVVARRTRWPRSFTVKEFARAVVESPLDSVGSEVMHRAHAERRASDLLTASSLDDISDPGLSASAETYAKMALELRRLVQTVGPVLATWSTSN
jgi:protein-tyrosine-phosphatase